MAIDETTAKLMLGAISVLWGALAGAVVYIRHLYDARDQIRLETIANRDRRIEALERRQTERDAKDERYVAALEDAVKAMKVQADATQTALDRATAGPRRRTTGD